MEKFNLAEVKAKTFPHLRWHDVFEGSGLTPDEEIELAIYFAGFTTNTTCPGCSAKLVDSEVMQLMGMTTFTWGLAHGEGYCRKCGYPARGYHFNVGPIKRLALILPYHPDELRAR